MQRVILHCDMNNFYASVECMLNPELKNKPVAVCGSVEERHGIVLAKNYAAKAFGVSTGEAIWQAKQKCQELVIVEPHYEQYMKFSKLAREIYGRYTDQIEPYGMDECWLDVTGSGCMGTGFEIADSLDFEVTPHLLRHTYITNLIHASVDPKTVQYLAGHENSKITMDIYAKAKYNRPDELAGILEDTFTLWDAE